MREYQPLHSFFPALAGPCTLTQPAVQAVTLDSPALEVMTDLARFPAITIDRSAPIATANDYMVTRGVRSLFVIADDGHVLGLVTTTDILGERPLRVSRARGARRSELSVADVMTPIDAVVAMRIEDVRGAKVGHVVATLKQAGRHHELVAELGPDGRPRIRGMFSASEIARRLGIPLAISELAQTFAEVEQALGT